MPADDVAPGAERLVFAELFEHADPREPIKNVGLRNPPKEWGFIFVTLQEIFVFEEGYYFSRFSMLLQLQNTKYHEQINFFHV